MKFCVDQNLINKAVNIVQRAISNKVTMEILKNIYIETTNNAIKIVGNDSNTGIETFIPAEIIEHGICTVNGRLFGEIIKKMPDETIEISLNNTKLNIKCNQSTFNLTSSDPKEYIDLPTIESDKVIKIDKYILSDMIRQTIFATSQDESRPILTGSLLQITENTIKMVSIDLYRVAIKTINTTSALTTDIVIPAKALSELLKLMTLKTEDEAVTMYISDKHIKFKMDDITMITRQLEGKFIDYDQIIPKTHTTSVICNKHHLMQAIDRASLIAMEGKNTSLKFSIQDNLIEITTNVEIGSVSEVINAKIDGPALKIGFNPKYWMDVLKIIDADEISIELTTNTHPCIIKPISSDNYTYLLLPVRILS